LLGPSISQGDCVSYYRFITLSHYDDAGIILYPPLSQTTVPLVYIQGAFMQTLKNPNFCLVSFRSTKANVTTKFLFLFNWLSSQQAKIVPLKCDTLKSNKIVQKQTANWNSIVHPFGCDM
jgi:hypothetical protein